MDSNKKELADSTSVSEDQSGFDEIFPLCLEDSTINKISKSLKSMISWFSENESQTNDDFVAVLYILAVECGYSWNIVNMPWHQRNYYFSSNAVHSIPMEKLTSGRMGNGEYRFTLYLGASENLKCTLSVVPCADTLVVNLSSTNPLICFSKAYISSDYIKNTEINFTSFRTLCISGKNDLFYPMKCYLLRDAGIKSATLPDLPSEVVIHIVSFVSPRDFLNLCATCRDLRSDYNDCPCIWKYFCKKFKFISNNVDQWKKHFRFCFPTYVNEKRGVIFT